MYYELDSLFALDGKTILDAFFAKSEYEIYTRAKQRTTGYEVLAKNPTTFDMGFSVWNEYQLQIDAILDRVKNSFNLVMVSDYMAESLVMLKEELCWDLDDVIYFTRNQREMEVNDRLREKVKNWNKIDYAIFEHYNKTFWERVHEGGQRFQGEVKKINKASTWLRKKCSEATGFKELKESKYRILCENMLRSEIDYTKLLKLKQQQP